jgi:hypothetical protein
VAEILYVVGYVGIGVVAGIMICVWVDRSCGR